MIGFKSHRDCFIIGLVIFLLLALFSFKSHRDCFIILAKFIIVELPSSFKSHRDCFIMQAAAQEAEAKAVFQIPQGLLYNMPNKFDRCVLKGFKSHRDCFIILKDNKMKLSDLGFKSHRDCFIISKTNSKSKRIFVSNPIGTAL